MIHRMVMIKLQAKHRERAARGAVAERCRQVLPSVPGVVEAWVGTPLDARTEGDWDLAIRIVFSAESDIAPYIVHPMHRELVDDFLKPRSEALKAWNFEAP